MFEDLFFINEASNSAPRVSKHVTKESDVAELLAITEDDVTTSLIVELFGEFNEKCRFNPYDTFDVPPNSYGIEDYKNKNWFTTTIGIWILNRFMFEQRLVKELGYINSEINAKKWDSIIDKITDAVNEDRASVDDLDSVLQKAQKLMPMSTVISPSITQKFLEFGKAVEPKKKELFKKYEKEIQNGDVIASKKMEDELMAFAMDYLKDDPSLDIYLSGARSSLGNNFKNMYLMKGAIRNPDPNAEHEFNIATSCYNDGIKKEEYAMFCDSLSAGPYSRAKKTEIGGYWEKLIASAYQHLTLGPVDSDCGTKDTVEEVLTEKNATYWMYSYIVDPSKGLVELNSTNRDQYIGKKVKFRFTGLCESKDCFCNKCAGNLFYKLDKQNIGLCMPVIGSILKNKAMKAFHDSTVGLSTINPKDVFGE